ncbi:Taurochenodeoxycholic 6 alpha-hydroxylase [Hypsizygus marmoreus]|uniref:Taurochenodeoxycholic 6 alpha-hydroxylase n=1 Tax=Hypsizygus marmoreus TaxID=39966 RepID=A0A369J547_HYPMA|nr:Taurochenodeoxycholic 6 alpha-hydroxylase [Hypsizygus marmoreus]
MDTTSSALSASFHMLAKNQYAQNRLREELTIASPDRSNISYDELSNLPFLDAVCRETLRLFPPVSTVYRKTATNAILPLSTPIIGADGTSLSEVAIPADTSFIVSVLSSNRNPSIWGPDSYEWKPQRWLAPLPETVKEAPIPGVYSHLMTFLGGGHACLGFKFSQLEMKIVLFILISNFKFELSEKDDDIIWQTTDISAPCLKSGGKRTSQLPLRVTAISPEH